MFAFPLNGAKASAVPPKLVGMMRYRLTNPSDQARPARLWFAFTGGTYFDKWMWMGNDTRTQPEQDYKGKLRLDASNVLMDGERIRCIFEAPGALVRFHPAVPVTGKQESDPRYQMAMIQNLLKNVVTVDVKLGPRETKDIVRRATKGSRWPGEFWRRLGTRTRKEFRKRSTPTEPSCYARSVRQWRDGRW